MNIGILGVGIIGSAIIEGFCYNNDKEHVLYISPRGKERSVRLSNKYEQVIRCETNQEVIDHADIVIISLLPRIGLEVISELNFRSEQHVINLMRNIKLDAIKDVVGETKTLTHMVPLSFISKREGPIAIYPGNAFVFKLFDNLGNVIPYDSMKKIESVAAVTGLMTSYYRILNDVSKWGENSGLSKEESVQYTTKFFAALTQHAKTSDLEMLSSEVTVGGINEYALSYLSNSGTFSDIIETLDPMLEEVQGKRVFNR